jgi:hypothetical protein
MAEKALNSFAGRGLALAALAAALVLAHGGVARAVILPAATVDGPSEDIVGFGGVAMAEDGTGGAVYLKRVEGVAHVFVARYVDHHWAAPIRVDREQPFAASWARIGAAEGGELVVVWATPFATEESKPVDELLGATLGPGSATFSPATIIDPDIRSGTGTSPDLAMSTTGQADVVYRVVNESSSHSALLRPGDVIEEVRVAHYEGERWSRLGAVNRNTGISMRPPTSTNAPSIAIGPSGNGVVVWQEPDIDGVARIWARRIFGRSLDYVLPVSAPSLSGAPIATDADSASIAISRIGQAEVVYRQPAGSGSPLPGPRILINTLPDGESADGSQFQGAIVADSEVPGGAGAAIGSPNVDIDEKQDVRVLYDSNGTPRVIEGDDKGLTRTVSLGPRFAGAEPASSASIMNPAGGGVSAWPSADSRGAAGVAVREDFPEGAAQSALVGGGAGGPVSELAVARSGLGDGLVGFLQGPIGQAAVVVDQVSAPPAQFVISVPKTWVKPQSAVLAWQPAATADGPLNYRAVLDARILRTPPGAMSLRLPGAGLGDGVHRVQVLATNVDGESTLTPPAALKVDGRPPILQVRRAARHSIVLRLRDAGSGVEPGSVRISFGDGGHARGRASSRHRYTHAGVYQIVIEARDRVGNRASIKRIVSVP